MEPATIRLNIKKAWYDKQKPVIGEFSMTVKTGETATLVGPSGVGKTTVLMIIAGLHKRFEGTIETNGKIALIPQKDCLPPFYNVYDNITLLAGSRKPDRRKAFAMLDGLGLSGFENRYPNQLSGGQYRRLALGQALYAEPEILLMDEPFSALDDSAKQDAIDLLLRVQRLHLLSMVLVTHDVREAAALNGRLLRLKYE